MILRARIRRLIPEPIRRLIRRILPAPPGPVWYPAPSISRQSIAFNYHGRTLNLEADHSIPLYETIAELVDYDAYQFGALQLPPPGPVRILDVGANIGAASVLLATIPGAQVLAYEPLPVNVETMTANLQRNGLTNVTLRPVAVTDRDGQADFLPSEEANVGGRMAGFDDAKGHRISVQTLAWSSVLREVGGGEIYLVKIDCEGGEYNIVDQLDENAAGRIRYFTFEVHDLDARRSVVTVQNRLKQLGYRTHYKADIFSRPSLHHLLAESTLLIPE